MHSMLWCYAFYVVYLGLSFSKAYSSLKSITSSVAYRCLVITVLLLGKAICITKTAKCYKDSSVIAPVAICASISLV